MSVLEREFWIQYFYCLHQILINERNAAYYAEILNGLLKVIPYRACLRGYQLRYWAEQHKEDVEAAQLFFSTVQYLRKASDDQLACFLLRKEEK